MEVAADADVIVEGTVTSYDRKKQSLSLDVAHVLKGKESRDRLRVWGDNGFLCRPYVTRYPIGSTWIMAFFRFDTTAVPNTPKSDSAEIDTKGNYAISVCGAFALRVEGDTVVGTITTNSMDATDEADAETIRAAIKAWDTE